MDFLEIRKRAKAQQPADPSPAKPPAPPQRAEVRTETARDALEEPGLPLPRRPSSPEAPPPRGSDTRASSAIDPLLEFFFRPDEGAGELEELAAGLEPLPEAEDEAPREFLGFVLAGEEYAVELELVREIVKVPAITEVPRAPAEITGIMSLRGEVMPVFDLRKRLGLPATAEPSRRARVVIVDLGNGPAGVQVDGVHQVVRLKPSTIEPPPPGLGVESEYLSGIGRLKDRMYVLLNLRAVISRPRSFSGERR
ncbi:MAG TPA: chemotaxis protein CheW [Myxococcales bacterium]|jgi:purine-binding chemotaxis protein CheW|nr:chemotaxis protein CheW [Myxococcales bacterium]